MSVLDASIFAVLCTVGDFQNCLNKFTRIVDSEVIAVLKYLRRISSIIRNTNGITVRPYTRTIRNAELLLFYRFGKSYTVSYEGSFFFSPQKNALSLCMYITGV